MTDRRFRVTVERFHPDGLHTTYALNIDPPELDEATKRSVDELLADLLDKMGALGIQDPAATLAVLLIEDMAEERAYARVAERRGVLAL